MYPPKKSLHDPIIVLLIKIKKGKLPKHSSPEEWISGMWLSILSNNTWQ